jgi:MFS family permease
MAATPVESTDASHREAARAPAFAAFGWGVGSWFGAFGMQSVLFSWLVVGELNASAETVGLVQTASMVPSLFLLLLGGHTADHSDARRSLICLHLLAALPPLLLAAAVAMGALSVPALVVFGLGMGSLGAFVMPARDTLLSRVAGADMMRSVSAMTAVQFGAQALGSLVAGGARVVGSAPMLCLQGAILALGALATRRIPPAPPPARSGTGGSTWRELTAGLPVVARTPKLRWPFVLVVAVRCLFAGPFMVCVPLLVRDVYAGDAFRLSLVMMMFPIGTIGGSLLIRARGGIRRKGQAALLAMTFGAANMGLIGVGLPFWAMMAATLAWGLGGSVFINCSRTLFQESAPANERARVLSIYQLGFMGAAPVGAATTGLLVAQIGLLDTLQVFAATMFVVVVGVGLLTQTRRME